MNEEFELNFNRVIRIISLTKQQLQQHQQLNGETKQTYEHMQVCNSSPINFHFFFTSIISVVLIH